jgi:hypothetical protein
MVYPIGATYGTNADLLLLQIDHVGTWEEDQATPFGAAAGTNNACSPIAAFTPPHASA